MTSQQRTLRASYFEAFLNSFVVGLAENFFTAFALQQGVSPLQTGLLISLPLIFAAIGQFTTLSQNQIARFTHPNANASSLVGRSTLVQAVALVILAIWGWSEFKPGQFVSFFSLLTLFGIYWYGHFVIQPAWNRWISEFVPTLVSQKFFSARTWLNQVGIICGLLVGGFGLHLNYLEIPISALFAGLFLFSFICKLGVYFFFSQHQQSESRVQLSVARLKSAFVQHQKFFKSYFVFNFAIYLSAPFVAGYLLSEKGLRYLEFTSVMIALFVGKIMTSTWLRNLKSNYDPVKLMFLGGAIAAPLPIFWPVNDSVYFMVLVHFISGMAWAAWEVGLSLCFFKNIQAEQKTETISVYNYLGVCTQVLGTLTGAFLVAVFFKDHFEWIFYVAGVARFIAVLPLRKNGLSNSTT